jgi:hypothetical protein
MNDFTKDELEEIKSCLKYMIKGGVTPHSCVTLAAKKKIQFMIDNLQKKQKCNHVWHKVNTSLNHEPPWTHICYICITCDKTTKPEIKKGNIKMKWYSTKEFRPCNTGDQVIFRTYSGFIHGGFLDFLKEKGCFFESHAGDRYFFDEASHFFIPEPIKND